MSTGLSTELEGHLELAFETDVLGVPTTVKRISLCDLPLPAPPLEDVESAAAYRRWAGSDGRG